MNRMFFSNKKGVAFQDSYLFDLDVAPAHTSGRGQGTVHFALDENNAIQSATFSLFADLNHNGKADDGAALATISLPNAPASNHGGFSVQGLTTGITYLLQVSGVLAPTVKNGSYQFSFKTAVPVPPALLLMATGVGALFGFGQLRKRKAAQTA